MQIAPSVPAGLCVCCHLILPCLGTSALLTCATPSLPCFRRHAASSPAAAAQPTSMLGGTHGRSGPPPPRAATAAAALSPAARCTRRPTHGRCATTPTCCRQGARGRGAGVRHCGCWLEGGTKSSGSGGSSGGGTGSCALARCQSSSPAASLSHCRVHLPPACTLQEAEWACTPVSAATELLPPAAQ